MSRKRCVRPDSPPPADSEVQQDLAARLAQHGEAFMQMFDDEDAPPSKRIASSNDKAALLMEAAEEDESSDSEHEPVIQTSAKSHSGLQAPQRPVESKPVLSLQAGRLASKAERRRFMSGKAADVHHKPSSEQLRITGPQARHAGQAGSPLSRDEFLSMQREVQQVGATALDRKARRTFDAWQLQGMKATPQKPGRVSAAIGKGMAKKQAERDQRARDEAIASGMIKLKGSGKQRRSNAGVAGKGLLEDGGLFKAGMLRVKGPLSKGHKFKKGAASNKRAFSSSKIGDLNSNSQKAWNKAQERAKSKPKAKRPIR